ncbi:MAG: hypothetical protein ABIR60_08700 [Allosphingosinicella sp.]
MLNATQVWHRLKTLKAFKSMTESDFRPIVYGQTFTPAAGGAATASQAVLFPGGAIILGITASGFVPTAAIGGQSAANRQVFGIDFSFSNNEAIVVSGPLSADALLGGGDNTIFPLRELIIAPNQQIGTRVANYTTGALTVHVCFHCLIYRFAS